MKKVLVIVVSYNGIRWLERCLSSVVPSRNKPVFLDAKGENGIASKKSANNLDVDLYVIDNDSTDGSPDYVSAHFPQAKLVRSAENLGFSKANNLGFEWALKKGYEYVYLLNQDAWLAPGALDTLVAAAENHPDYAVLSPLHYQDGYQQLDIQFRKILPGTKTAETLSVSPENGGTGADTPDLMPVRRVMAAHWLVPVAALRKIGLFEEELFPLYGQDDDWCQRARYHGWRIGIVPEAKAVHDRAQRTEAKEKLIRRNYYTGSLVRLCDINRPLWERFCFVLLFTLVKTVKYGSVLPLKYFRQICRQLPTVRQHRRHSR